MTDEREETQEEYEERREHDMAMSEFVDDFDADRVITTQSVFRIDRAVTGQVDRPRGWGRLLSLANDVEATVKERDELRAQVAALTAERDKARADYAYVVERAADQRLDGYRELGARAAAAENERDALRARVAELEAHELAVALATGIAHEPSMGPCYPGPRGEVVAEIERLRREARDAYECRARIATLESPPVVPEGWEIGPIISAEASGWAVTVDGNIVVMWHPQTNGDIKAQIKAPVAVFEALLHAIRTDKRPPHAGDVP